jgi:hypothetical protein
MRSQIRDFQLDNPIYRNALVTFYTVSAGVKTNVLATLYGNKFNTDTLPNPQRLDSNGRFRRAVYIDTAVVGVVSGLNTPSHETGVIDLVATGVTVTPFSETMLSQSSAASWIATLGLSFVLGLSAATGDSLVGHQRDAATTISTTVQQQLNDLTLRLNEFIGVDPTGVADSTLGVAQAIATARATGKPIYCDGKYKLNGVIGADGLRHGFVVPYSDANGVGNRIHFTGRAQWIAGNSNMLVGRWSDSHGSVSGAHVFYAAGQLNVRGFCVYPESTTQTTTVVQQLYNSFSDIYCVDCAEGISMQVGPKVLGVDSGCSYNAFTRVRTYNCVKGLYLRSPIVSCSGNNRNNFSDSVFGHGPNAEIGALIESGSTNVFKGTHFEGNLAGLGRGVQINLNDSPGSGAPLANEYNMFDGCFTESNTVDMHNDANGTRLSGGFWRASTFTGSIKPWMDGGNLSFMPHVTPSFEHGEGVSGFPSGYLGFKVPLGDYGFIPVTNSIVLGDWTNVTSVSGVLESYSMKLNGMVNLVIAMNFRATVAGTRLTCVLPHACADIIKARALNNPIFGKQLVNNGGGFVEVEVGITSTGLLYINSPTWDTTGNNNQVVLVLVYKGA